MRTPSTFFAYRTALAAALIEDIERARQGLPELVLKGTRLARLVGAAEILQWLKYELHGYDLDQAIAVKYIGLTGRWIDVEKQRAYLQGIATLEAQVAGDREELTQIALIERNAPAGYVDYVTVPLSDKDLWQARARQLGGRIQAVATIRTRMMALLHSFATRVQCEGLLSTSSDLVYERFRQAIDTLLGITTPEALSIEELERRIASGESASPPPTAEACRSMIRRFADALFPPRETRWEGGQVRIPLDLQRHANRINAHLMERCASRERATRLGRTLTCLDRRLAAAEAGATMPPDEARAVLAATYLTLGEILQATTGDYARNSRMAYTDGEG